MFCHCHFTRRRFGVCAHVCFKESLCLRLTVMNYFLKQVKLLLFNPRRDVAVESDWVSRLIFGVAERLVPARRGRRRGRRADAGTCANPVSREEQPKQSASSFTLIMPSRQLIAPCSSRKRMCAEVTRSSPTALCSRVLQTDCISSSTDKYPPKL